MQFNRTNFLFLFSVLLGVFAQPIALGQTLPSGSAVARPDLATFAVTEAEIINGLRAVLFQKFGVVTTNEEKAILDGYASELQSDPKAVGYIIVFGKKGRPASEAKKRADFAKDYLWNYNRTSNTLQSIDHCYRAKVEYELWIVPVGASPPPTCIIKPSPAKVTISKSQH